MNIWKIVSLAAGFTLLYVIMQDIDLGDVAGLVSAVGVGGVCLVVLIYFFAFLGDSISWLLILTSLPVSFSWIRRTFVVRLAGEAFNNVVPAGGFAGEPVKAVILKSRYGVSYTEASASIVMARTVNMIALIVFLMIGFAFMMASDAIDGALKLTASAGLIFLTVGTALLFAVQRFSISSWLSTKFGRQGWAARAAGAIKVIEDLDRRFVTFYTRNRRRLWAALLLAFINWALGVIEIYVTFKFLGTDIAWSDAWMMEALAQMIRAAVFFIPLGIGAQEGAFVVIATAITGTPSLGLACAAVRRIRELLWVFMGLAAWTLYPSEFKDTDKREDAS
ncbi:MAG: flippase-like domain-containing protein [Rhodospirillales bacterium]|nr:flippase-like domain-containing protein [Rhodospirillales bacterium]MBO6788818.1 flippase-like domain-containing protein [Rhodospirillales bacterium]